MQAKSLSSRVLWRAALFLAFPALAATPPQSLAAKVNLDRFALSPPIIVDVEESAVFLVTGDFDGDKKPDFAVFDARKNLLRLFHARDLSSMIPSRRKSESSRRSSRVLSPATSTPTAGTIC